MKKDMFKIRKMLGKNYHLCEECKWNENKLEETWKVYAVYRGWIDDNSKPIMTSETHSYEDLYKFAKKHNEWDLDDVICNVSLIIQITNILVAFLNIFWSNKALRGFIWAIILYSFIESTARIIVSEHNWKISKLKWKEHIERLIKWEEKENKDENKTNDISER